MIRINLLPIREIAAAVGRRQELVIGGISLGIAIALIVVLHLIQTYRLSSLRAEAGDLKQEIQELNKVLKEVGDLEQKVKALRGKVQAIEDLGKKKVGPVRVMESLISAIPARLWLTEFKEAGGSLTISGVAIDNQTVAEFLKALSASPYFSNVDLVETNQVDQDGAPLKKFAVRSQVLYQASATAPEQKTGVDPKTPPTKEAKKS